jgi:hypothetical protein
MSRDYPTNSDDVIDIRSIIDRVEELRDERKPKIVVGMNMPGYMPDSEPSEYFGWEDARKALIALLDEAASADGDNIAAAEVGNYDFELNSETLEEVESRYVALRAAIKSLEDNEPEEDFGRTFGKYHYFMDDTLEEGIDDEDEDKELKDLESLLESLKGYGGDHQWEGDWYPVTLVRESYFEDYARQFAEDVGAISGDEQWPANCIDWERAARELRMDYSSVDFDGETYWYR